MTSITYAQLLATFTTFLTASIHTVLHARALYPARSFASTKLHNTPIYQSRHPAVCAWVAAAVDAASAELLAGTVARIVLVVYSPAQKPLERFVFDVDRFPIVLRKEDRDRLLARDNDDGDDDDNDNDDGDDREEDNGEDGEDDDSFVDGRRRAKTSRPNSAGAPPIEDIDLSEQYRAALIRLSTCASRLSPLPPGCSYTLAVELKNEAKAPIGHPQPWIPTQSKSRTSRGKGSNGKHPVVAANSKDLNNARTTPVRTVEARELAFEMWVEEGRAKLDLELVGAEASTSTSGNRDEKKKKKNNNNNIGSSKGQQAKHLPQQQQQLQEQKQQN